MRVRRTEGRHAAGARLEHTCSARTLWALRENVDDAWALQGFGPRVPHSSLIEELRALAEERGDEVGLRAAQLAPIGPFDLLHYLSRACGEPRRAIESALRYSPLVHDALSLHCVSDGSCLFLSFERPAELAWPRELSELMLAGLALALRRGSGLPCTLRSASFAHPAPRDVGLRNFVLGCAVDYDARVDAVAFGLDELERSSVAPDRRLHGLLVAYAEYELSHLFATWSFAARVRRLLHELFPARAPTQEEVASRLGCSVRTLHRHLRKEETSYRKLVDEVREELALRYLVRERLEVGRAASLLGYAQASAFRRAFRRWTASTPSAARRSGRRP
jgi:AraC-like DNA-binding protein